MAKYVHDEKNNRIEALSKEEIYALIDEVIESGELPTDAQTAFVTALKSIVDGNAYKIGFCTQAEYNQLEAQGELEVNALYIITDDETEQDLEAAIEGLYTAITDLDARTAANESSIADLDARIAANESSITNLQSRVSTLEAQHIYRHDIVWGNRTAGNFYIVFTIYNTTATQITTSTLKNYIETYTNVNGYVGSNGTLYNATELHYTAANARWYISAIKDNQYLGFDITSSSDFSNITDTVTQLF